MSIKGFLKKELLLVFSRPVVIIYVIFLPILGVLCAYKNCALELIFIPLIFVLLPYILAEMDVISEWIIYASVTPFGRRNYISAKYIASLAMYLIGILVSVPILIPDKFISESGCLTEFIPLSLSTGLFIALMIPTLGFPALLLLGRFKKLLLILIFIVVQIALALYIMLIVSTPKLDSHELMRISAEISAAAIACFALSWLITLKLFARKDL